MSWWNPADVGHSVRSKLADMGHADILCGGPLRWGRRLCGGGDDPAAVRAQVTALLVAFIQRG